MNLFSPYTYLSANCRAFIFASPIGTSWTCGAVRFWTSMLLISFGVPSLTLIVNPEQRMMTTELET